MDVDPASSCSRNEEEIARFAWKSVEQDWRCALGLQEPALPASAEHNEQHVS